MSGSFPKDESPTAVRSFTVRRIACCMCGAEVHAVSATTSDPEAPEMLQLPADAWIGLVRDAPSDETRVILCCSRKCLTNLLREKDR